MLVHKIQLSALEERKLYYLQTCVLAKLAWQPPPLVCSTGSRKRKLYKQIMENQGIEDPEVKYEAKII